MKKQTKILIVALIVMFALVPTVLISGCVGQSSAESGIKSSEQAAEVVSNISQDVQDVSSVLDDIDKTLGS